MRKYDEYGRPIKDNSFFDKFSKPKKREYSYKKETVEEKKTHEELIEELTKETPEEELNKTLGDVLLFETQMKIVAYFAVFILFLILLFYLNAVFS